MGWEEWNNLVDPSNRFETTKKNSRPASIAKPSHIVIHITGTNQFDTVKNRFMNQSASAHYLVKTDGTIVQFVKDKDRAWHAGIMSCVRDLYDKKDGSWKKYLRYFNWYTYPSGSKYLTGNLTDAQAETDRKLVAKEDGSDWDDYGFWSRHGSRNTPINYGVSKDPNDYSIGIELLTTGGKSKAKYAAGLYSGLSKLLNDLVKKYDIPKDRLHIVGHEDVNPVERWGWDPNSGFDWEKVMKGLSPSFSLPLDLSTGHDPTLEALQKYYQHTEKDHPGGYFPVALNTTWHGGVHLHADKGAEVKSMAPGIIVGARLGETDTAMGHYGSRNLILVKHEAKKNPYYSLYLHLNAEKLDQSNKVLENVGWLMGKDKKLDTKLLDSLKRGEVVAMSKSVSAGDTLWTIGEYGSPNYRKHVLHWEVFGEHLLPGAWAKIEDTDQDFNCDNKKLVDLIDQEEESFFVKTKPDGILSRQELVDFFSNPQKCEPLRYYACKFISEYAVNWDTAVDKLKGRFITYGLADRLKQYNFWDEAKKAKVDLPKSSIVWHFNPIGALEQMLFTSARTRFVGEYFEKDRSFPLNDILPLVNATFDHITTLDGTVSVLSLGYVNDGEAGDKKKLSAQRSESIMYLLRYDKDSWCKQFTSGVWGHRERQIMLAYLLKSDGTPYYEKKIDGIDGPGQKAAVKEFQADNGLTDDGVAGPKTLDSLFDSYYLLLRITEKKQIKSTCIGCADSHKDHRPSKHIADLLVFPQQIRPSPEKYESSPEKVWKGWHDGVDHLIDEHAVTLNPTVHFVFPADKEHKQYVNLDDNNQDEGMNARLRVEVENPIEGQKIFWKVTADKNNSKRNDPMPGLKATKGGSTQMLSNGTATCVTQVKDGIAEAFLVCGLAGGDKFTVEVGVENGKYLSKTEVTTKRRLYYELQSPEFIELDTVTIGEKEGKDYPDACRTFVSKVLDKVGVEYVCENSLVYSKKECETGSLFEPKFFNVASAYTRNIYVLPPSQTSDPLPFTASGTRTIKVRVCDKAYWWEESEKNVTVTISSLDASGSYIFNLYNVFKKNCLPKDLWRNRDGINVSSGKWKMLPPATPGNHPGRESSGGQAKHGSLSGWSVTNENAWWIRITPPKSLSKAIGAAGSTTCPVEVKFKVILCFPLNGAALKDRQVMVFKKPAPQSMGCTICHELGHSMGMTIMPGYNPPPAGLSQPKHVDNGGIYYRSKYTTGDSYGSDGVRGPNHKGGHCAYGIADRATSSDLGGKNGSCIMYGEGGSSDPPGRNSFCPTCTEHVKARNLRDIVNSWRGRNAKDC